LRMCAAPIGSHWPNGLGAPSAPSGPVAGARGSTGVGRPTLADAPPCPLVADLLGRLASSSWVVRCFFGVGPEQDPRSVVLFGDIERLHGRTGRHVPSKWGCPIGMGVSHRNGGSRHNGLGTPPIRWTTMAGDRNRRSGGNSGVSRQSGPVIRLGQRRCGPPPTADLLGRLASALGVRCRVEARPEKIRWELGARL
jgi:hypothetical protein